MDTTTSVDHRHRRRISQGVTRESALGADTRQHTMQRSRVQVCVWDSMALYFSSGGGTTV